MKWTDKLPTKSGWYGHITLYPPVASIDAVIVLEGKTIVYKEFNTDDVTDNKDDFWTDEPFILPTISKEIIQELDRRRNEH